MRTVKYILFVSKWVNEIYGDVIPPSVLKELNEYVTDSKMYLMFQRGNGNYIFLFDYLVSNNLLSLYDLLRGELTNKSIKLYKITLYDYKSQVILLTQEFDNERKFRIPDTSIELSYKIYMDAEKICIRYSIFGKKCAFYKDEGHLGRCDGIEFLAVKEKETVHRCFTLTTDEENVVVMSANEIVISNSDNLFQVNYMSNDDMAYTLELEFGWELLKVDFDEGNVAFNIAVLVGDSETATIMYRYNIFLYDQRMNIWDMKKMVLLTNGSENYHAPFQNKNIEYVSIQLEKIKKKDHTTLIHVK